MTVRSFLGSPVAVACWLAGAVAVGGVVAVGWLLAAAVHAVTFGNPTDVLGGFERLLVLVAVGVVAAAVVATWIPFSTGIAYAIGRTERGESVSAAGTARAVARHREALVSWVKTQLAVEPLAEWLLDDEDVRPVEVAAGCGMFVVPALFLDAPTVPRAVELANRVVPEASGRGRLGLLVLSPTAVVAATVFFWAAGSGLARPLAAGIIVLGGTLAAALDTAWRVRAYLSADTEGYR